MVEHQEVLRRLARKLCRDNFDPDDLVQDVMLKMVAHHERLPHGVNQVAWLACVMRNLFIDRVRARAASPSSLPIEDDALVCPDTEEQPWWEDISPEQVREAVTRLPDELRCAFERFAFERKSYKEISAELGVPVATVGTRVLRARRRLRVLLEGAGRD